MWKLGEGCWLRIHPHNLAVVHIDKFVPKGSSKRYINLTKLNRESHLDSPSVTTSRRAIVKNVDTQRSEHRTVLLADTFIISIDLYRSCTKYLFVILIVGGEVAVSNQKNSGF
ncbi:hypothetical protein AVEN_109939-1 [Araneus ventricosus]|uniref:Uncharacterized protein n=1 Tax=Araneus ventricosus TaxID=182803 RepID=A0A4Y2UFQ9_ARAVE|nr:hypothetical protein AVEN_109939-1 [Araneus ventricosus]